MIYLAAALRNAGNGVAVLHGWYPSVDWQLAPQTHAPVEQFRRLTRDLHIPAGDVGFWQAPSGTPAIPTPQLLAAIAAHDRPTVDILYGDHEGGQRAFARFALTPVEEGYLLTSSRYGNLDQRDPR